MKGRAQRVAGGVLACALCVVALGLVGFAAFGALLSLQAPDPFVMDGDPCCGHPNTWGEVIEGLGWALLLVALAGVLVAAAMALLARVSSQARPSLKRLALVPGAAIAIAGVIFAIGLVSLAGEGRDLPDCDGFRFDRTAWNSPQDDTRLAMTWGLAECGTLQGRTTSQVQSMLGPPLASGDLGSQWYLSYDGLDVILEGGRVVEVRAGYG